MSILIIGGAGYIGSHTVKYFLEQNEDIIVVDNLLTGHKEAILTDKFYTSPQLFNDIRKLLTTYQFLQSENIGISVLRKPYSLYKIRARPKTCFLFSINTCK